MPDQKCSVERVAEKAVMPIRYSTNSATPCTYTTNRLRVSAATAKNSAPMKNTCTTTMARNGCRYQSR